MENTPSKSFLVNFINKLETMLFKFTRAPCFYICK